ncbi:MAG: arylsulfatase [Pirellulales bacterium]|nr:arylsulfatase [Pirellulales bacterium]
MLMVIFPLSALLMGAAPSKKPPNIVFIMADDLGYGHLGCYGQKHIRTPNINRLAEEGMRFTQAYSGCTVCAPSRCCLMTGLHSGHISVRGNGGGVSLQEEDVTVAGLLRQNGYTNGLFGKWGLGKAGTAGVPNRKGFDEFFGYLHQLHAQFYYTTFLWDNDKKVSLPQNANGNPGTYTPDLIMDRAVDFVRRYRDKPFFLYLPVTIPHHEFIAPEETMKLYRGKFPETPITKWRDKYALPREPKATFAAMVTHLDKGVGRLMDVLSELGLDENTIVFFTSDNGGAEGPLENPVFFQANGPFRGYKRDMYEGGLRVPMIVRFPGRINPGSISRHVTYFPDMLPTFLDLAGCTERTPKEIDGLSIAPVLFGKKNAKQHDFLYWETADYGRKLPYDIMPETLIQAVRQGRWKAVKNGPDVPVELYDLESDVGEKHNLATRHPVLTSRLSEIMDREHRPAPPQVDLTAKAARQLYIPKVGVKEP